MFVSNKEKNRDPESIKNAYSSYITFMLSERYTEALPFEEFEKYKLGEFINDTVINAMNFGVEELFRKFDEYTKEKK